MIRMTGIDHTQAPVDIRSVFSFRQSEMPCVMENLKEKLGADGIVLLSTCNRMEIWTSQDSCRGSLTEALCGEKGVSGDEYGKYFTERDGGEAVEHLFKLACGLKSAIIAEDQIVTQVKDALAFSREHYQTDNVLEVLFRMAITSAKKIKTNVVYERADRTAMEAAIREFKENGFDVAGKKCMVIGNGQFGKISAETLVRYGADVTVTVRQYHSGTVLIPDGCRKILYEDKMKYFPECELVVSATASPNYTLFYDQVKEADVDHDMILVDFAVPRDIEPGIAALPGYTIYDLDHFHSKSGDTCNDAALCKAESIIKEKMDEFYLWYDSRSAIPQVDFIRDEAGKDVWLRLSKTLKRLPIDDAEKDDLGEHIRESSGKVVSHILFMLRDELSPEQFRKCMGTISDAYMLDEKQWESRKH